jgi:hypothetical protein
MTRQRRPSTTEVITETLEQVEQKVEDVLTVLWNDLPHWQQDNHYIHSGYRPASYSFRKSFASLGYLHNESVNIYSHLIGAVLFSISAFLLYSGIKPRYDSATSSDILAFGCFFLGAALCLGMSATYHAISNHSPIVARLGNKLDYVGIVCLITGSFIPSVFYGFYCHLHLQEFYWTMVCPFAIYDFGRSADCVIDLFSRSGVCYSVHIRPIQDSRLASLSSGNVRSYGIVCRISCTSWGETLWGPGDARKDRTNLACASRLSLYPRGRAIRSESLNTLRH